MSDDSSRDTSPAEKDPAAELGPVYGRVGGEEWFVAVVERFYASVETDPVLRPLYPADLSGAKDRLASFLGQYWGGPALYSEQRGHPRLRMRHARFPIGTTARNAWYRHMSAAVKSGGLNETDEKVMLSYFAGTATMLMNRPDEPRTQ